MGHDDDQQLNLPTGNDRQDVEAETQPATESVEQYVHLHEHIERLRADRRPAPPGTLSDEEVRTYQMAALFRAAVLGADDPDPVFASRLLRELEGMRSSAKDATAEDTTPPVAAASAAFGTSAAPPTAPAPTVPTQPPVQPLVPRRGISRRSILARGLGAAAAAAVGVAGGMAIEREMKIGGSGSNTSIALVPSGTGIWVTVAKADAIPVGGVLHFTTDYIVGFVRHTSEGFTALSGVCTHMGCLLQWNTTARTFDCPCHGGRFAEDGTSAPSSEVWYKPLPKLGTRVEDGQVQVYVVPPTSPTAPGAPAAGDPSGPYGSRSADNV
jgi:Rieske Fe-S protein